MTGLAFAVAGWLFLVGLYGIVTSRNLIHLIVCLSVVQSSTYVFLVTVGYHPGDTPAVLSSVPSGATLVDPVLATLALTDVVVAAAVTALLLTLAVQAHKKTGSLDPDDLRVLHH